MRTPLNSFKAGLVAGQKQIGFWLALGDPLSAEICATAGFDWLLIDAEHGPNDLRSLLSQIQAVAAYSSPLVVRGPALDPVFAKQTLELGVQSLLTPMVDSPEQAAIAARAMRYPPNGMRGVGSGLARSSRWGAAGDYLRQADEEMCCIVQLETTRSLEQLEAIAAVPGVDALFIGAADLAADMNLLGQPSHPQVTAALDDALARASNIGKPCGFLATEPAAAQRLLAAGAQFVAVGVDSTILARGARSLAREFGRGPNG